MNALPAEVLKLYRAALQCSPGEFEIVLFRLIDACIPISSAIFAEMQHGPSGLRVYGIQLHNEPARLADDLPRLNRRHDTVIQLVIQRPRRSHAVLQRQLFGKPDQREMLEYVRRYGHANVMAIADISDSRARGAWLSLYRARDEHVFSHTEQRLLALLMPHLAQARRINDEINGMPKLLGGLGGLRALVTYSGVIIVAGSGFRQTLQRHRPDWLSPRLPTDMLEDLRSSRTRQQAPSGITIVQRPFDGYLLLEARPPPAEADLLTARQRQIAALFARGFSHKHIARMLELSPATVRNVIPRVYRKLRVNNKIALARVLSIQSQ